MVRKYLVRGYGIGGYAFQGHGLGPARKKMNIGGASLQTAAAKASEI